MRVQRAQKNIRIKLVDHDTRNNGGKREGKRLTISDKLLNHFKVVQKNVGVEDEKYMCVGKWGLSKEDN